MMASRWVGIGCGLLVVLGLSAILIGWWIPGSLPTLEGEIVSAKPKFSEIKKRSEDLVEQLDALGSRTLYSGSKGMSHRVFVSRTLVFLPGDKGEPVQPLDPKMKMQDGIDVGWKLEHGLDPANPAVKDGDPDQDGFTNFEEYSKGTNPNDATSSPSRWIKIKIASVDTNSLTIGLSGKSANRFTLRFVLAGRRKDVDVELGEKLWLVVHAKGLEVVKRESELVGFKDACSHPIPIVVKSYHDDKGRRMDGKTKTENEYDDSYLEIERRDGLQGISRILLDEKNRSRGVTWLVGDIRLFSSIPGEGEMGPYRVGQKFTYSGKEFCIRDASTQKVTLWMMPEGVEVQILHKTP